MRKVGEVREKFKETFPKCSSCCEVDMETTSSPAVCLLTPHTHQENIMEAEQEQDKDNCIKKSGVKSHAGQRWHALCVHCAKHDDGFLPQHFRPLHETHSAQGEGRT